MEKLSRPKMICKMIHGDKQAIRDGLLSDNPYLRIDALLWIAYHHMNLPELIEKIHELKNDDSQIMGYTVSSHAIATLDALGIEAYNGNDQYQKALNANIVPTKEQAEAFLLKYQ